jgi:hypothetical protein
LTKSLGVAISLSLALALVLFPAPAATYAPHPGDHFGYYEVEDLGNGTGSYAGYSEQTVVNGAENMNGISGGVVNASYSYSYAWSNSTGGTETGTESGEFTFSPTTFLYVNGTDDQTGYVNPTVWFYMNSSIPVGGTFYLLNTQTTVTSRNYSYYLPSQGRSVVAISAQGTSSYLRDDHYGEFNATYTWTAYFDPSTGYIIGYGYAEHDTSSSGDGFTYTDNLYVTSTSYPLVTAAAGTPTQNTNAGDTAGSQAGNLSLATLAVLGLIVVVILLLAYAALSRRRTLPQHPSRPAAPPTIDLTPKEQPPVQQVVIKEVAMVNCKYCGTLIDSTAQVCPRCGAPRT